MECEYNAVKIGHTACYKVWEDFLQVGWVRGWVWEGAMQAPTLSVFPCLINASNVRLNTLDGSTYPQPIEFHNYFLLGEAGVKVNVSLFFC